MPDLAVNVTIDSKNLTAGIAAAWKYSKRTMPEIVNTAGYWISVNALHNTPFVAVERINTELGVIVTPKIGKRGKPLSTKSAKNRVYSSRVGDVPVAALIVAARANPSSHYNQLTGGRYKLDKNPFKGVSRAAGRAAMAALVHRMIAARRSSVRFIGAGFVKAIHDLKAFAAQKFLKGGPSPSEGDKDYHGADLGEGIPGEVSSLTPIAYVRSYVGTEGANAGSHNRALLTYAAPALQQATTQEGEYQANYALRKMAEELKEETDKHWK